MVPGQAPAAEAERSSVQSAEPAGLGGRRCDAIPIPTLGDRKSTGACPPEQKHTLQLVDPIVARRAGLCLQSVPACAIDRSTVRILPIPFDLDSLCAQLLHLDPLTRDVEHMGDGADITDCEWFVVCLGTPTELDEIDGYLEGPR